MNNYWLAFDLTVRGPYDKFYKFLDELNAKQCIDELAFIESEMNLEEFENHFEQYFSKEKIEHGSVVYLIYEKKGKHIGKFLIGGRKRALWTGYAEFPSTKEDGDDEI